MSATGPELRWLLDGERGISSATIWHVLTRDRFPLPGWEPDRPRDPADLRRCMLLLDRFPEWRARLGEVAAAYPAWIEIVAAWPELERTFREEVGEPGADDWPPRKAPRTWELMKKVRGERCLCGARRLDEPELEELHEVDACGGRRRIAGGGGRR